MAVVAIAAVAIAVTVASCGAAAAGAGFLASYAVCSIGAYSLAATAMTVATIATYVVATTVVVGITAFAIADIQEIITDGQNNYLSFLGDTYEPIKNTLYCTAFIFPYLAQFAPQSYYDKLTRKKIYREIDKYSYTQTVQNHTDRSYNNSLLLQKEIVKYGNMSLDEFGYGYVFTIDGSFNGGEEITWKLGVNDELKQIWHFGRGF